MDPNNPEKTQDKPPEESEQQEEQPPEASDQQQDGSRQPPDTIPEAQARGDEDIAQVYAAETGIGDQDNIDIEGMEVPDDAALFTPVRRRKSSEISLSRPHLTGMKAEFLAFKSNKGQQFKDQTDIEASVLGSQEKDIERKVYGKKFRKAFALLNLFGKLVLRFPLSSSSTEEGFIYTFNLSSVSGYLFAITFILNLMLLIWTSLGAVFAILNYPSPPENITTADGSLKTAAEMMVEESILYVRNLMPIVVMILTLINVLVGDFVILKRRKFVGYYFTSWTDATDLMKIDATFGVGEFILALLLFHIVFLGIFFALAGLRFAPMTSGVPAAVGMLWARYWYPSHYLIPSFFTWKVAACVFYAYAVLTSRVHALILIFMSKVLSTAFNIWNTRLESVLHSDVTVITRQQQHSNRIGFDHLFKDHVSLLDLLAGSDTFFENIIETIYTTQTISIVFEFYYLYGSLVSDISEFRGARKLDTVVIGLWVIHSAVFLFLTATTASDVGENAMNGLEIIRRKGNFGHKSEQELYFMLSLYMSYSGHFDTALSGGGYYTIDRPFLVGLCGTLLGYVIIIIQFSPPLSYPNKKHLEFIDTRKLIMDVEWTKEYFQIYPIGYATIDESNVTHNVYQNFCNLTQCAIGKIFGNVTF